MHSHGLVAVGLSLLSIARAQTSTSCNPTESTNCGSDEGLQQSYYSMNFTQGASSDWNVTYGTVTYDDTLGATYTITESGDAPTMQTNFYVFFGEISIEMKTANGTGIISCAILESDDLDEIDFEFFGGSATEAETNYFGKGNTSTYDREQYTQMGDTQSDFHNYSVVWTESLLTWKIDGVPVRNLTYASALDGANYPQTPMRVKLGIWAGGDSSNGEGTIEWAGGETDYSTGPFTAYVRSVNIVNYNPGSSYTYGDTSGSYESIVIAGGTNGTTEAETTTTSSTSSTVGASTQAASATIVSIPTASVGVSVSGSTKGDGGAVSTNATVAADGSSNSTDSSSTSSSSSSSSSSSAAESSSSVVASSGAVSQGCRLGLQTLLGCMGVAFLFI